MCQISIYMNRSVILWCILIILWEKQVDRGGENDLKICVELVFFFLFLAANICAGNMEPAFALIHHDAPEICSLVDGKAAAAAAAWEWSAASHSVSQSVSLKPPGRGREKKLPAKLSDGSNTPTHPPQNNLHEKWAGMFWAEHRCRACSSFSSSNQRGRRSRRPGWNQAGGRFCCSDYVWLMVVI